ncbi:MAG: hypothetical protein LBQ12_05955 [Deltaproteobacteria bacterium]|jgi:hypothetical protein|nr:hypothetical protein [Deltaproteobacteria bacterium]
MPPLSFFSRVRASASKFAALAVCALCAAAVFAAPLYGKSAADELLLELENTPNQSASLLEPERTAARPAGRGGAAGGKSGGRDGAPPSKITATSTKRSALQEPSTEAERLRAELEAMRRQAEAELKAVSTS